MNKVSCRYTLRSFVCVLLLAGLAACVGKKTEMVPPTEVDPPPPEVPDAIPHTPAPPVRVNLTAALPGLAFYQSLDLDRADLADVARAVAAEDAEAAMTAYAAFLRAKDWGGALQPASPLPASDATTPEGEQVRQGQVRLLGHSHEYGKSIDWLGNPTAFSDWPLLLNRHMHWVDLAAAYR